MSWTDQRPMAFAEADAPLAAPPQDEEWRWEFELWSQPRPVEGSMWSTLVWWWERSDVGVVVTNAQGLTASGGRVPWGGLWQVQLEVWLLSDTYLELFVELKTRGEGVEAGVSAAFKVVLPHTWVSASVPVKQNAEVGYLDLEAFVEIWPLLCFYAQACDVHIQHLLILGSLDDELPTWDVEAPAEVAVPGADAGWWTRSKVDSLLNKYDAGAATSLNIPGDLGKDLEQEGFDYLFGRLASWPNLTTLFLSECISLKNVDGLGKLTNLTKLRLGECKSLKNVDGLGKLTNLTKLRLGECKSLENVDGLGKLTNLTELRLGECKSLENVDGLGKLTNLTEFSLFGCISLKNVDGLGKLTNLTKLFLSECISLKNVDGLGKLTNLTTLYLSWCKSLENVDGLGKLTNLTELSLSGCKSLKNVDGLGKLTNLTSLNLAACKSLKSVDALSKLTNLTTLDLAGSDWLKNVDVLGKLTNLTTLDLRKCDSLENVDVLANLTNLTYLNLTECTWLPSSHTKTWTGDKLQAFLKLLRESQSAT